MSEKGKELEISGNEVKIEESKQGYIQEMDIDTMKERLDIEAEKRDYLLKFIRDRLKPGVDYAMIHKKTKVRGQWTKCEFSGKNVLRDEDDNLIFKCPDCSAKYSLWKPGAEKICGFLNLKPKFEVDKETMEALGLKGKGVAYTCYLVTVGEEEPHKGYEGKGGRTLKQDGQDFNKCIKMAKKSALIDATLTIRGLSEMFTQDIEDIAKDNVAWDNPPEDTSDEKELPINEENIKKVFTKKELQKAYKKESWDEEDIEKFANRKEERMHIFFTLANWNIENIHPEVVKKVRLYKDRHSDEDWNLLKSGVLDTDDFRDADNRKRIDMINDLKERENEEDSNK